MAKPSLTKSSAPKTPPQTVWDLNDLNQNTAYYAVHTAAPDEYATLLAQVNTTPVIEGILGAGLMEEASEVTALLGEYDYVFLGTNGGSDETVTARDDLNGIIVTGDGKDHIFGSGNAEVILTGNGTDDAHGGAGDDIIFGENGQDSLYGEAGNDWLFGGNGPDTLVGGIDDGTFSAGAPTVVVKDGVTVFEEDPSGDTADGTGSDKNEVLKKEGIFIDGDDLYLVWSFEPADPPPAGGTLDVTVAVYDKDFNVLETFNATFDQDQQNFFKTALGESGHVAVFNGHDVVVADGNPSSGALKEQGYDASEYVTTTEGGFKFDAGDVLTGGAGPDNFVYHDGDGVDEVTDYNRDDGDVVTLDAVLQADADVLHQDGDSYIVFGDGKGGYLADAAIKLTGVADFDVSEINFV
jgi:Ca2+-binding RTX toxin-like protein